MRGLLESTLALLLLLSPLGGGWVWTVAESTAPPLMNTIVVLVEFEDKPFPSDFQTSILTRVLDQAVAYFTEVSAKRSAFVWTLHNRITRLDKPLAFYGSDKDVAGDDKGGNPKGLLTLITDTVSKVDAEIDFRRYRYLIISHSGADQAKTSQDQLSSDIWSQTLFRIQPPITAKPEGAAIDGASIISHTDPLGVWVHEIGHLVGQLPDMYVRGPGGSLHLAGAWSLMDQGAQLGDGKMPSHPDAWSKWTLGWLDFETLVLSKSFTTLLEAVNQNPRPTAIRIPLINGSFYVVEARAKRGFDSLLPREGVLIYLVTPARLTSETIVRLVDARPDTKTLDDAVLEIQKVYEDKANRVFIQVLRREGDRFTIRVGTELVVQFSSGVAKHAFTLQPVTVNLTVQPLITGLSYQLHVDGTLYEQGEMSRPQVIHDLYFTPWRAGNHNITFVVSDARNSIIYREVQQVAVENHPVILVAVFLILTALPIIFALRRRPIASPPQSVDNSQSKGLSDASRPRHDAAVV